MATPEQDLRRAVANLGRSRSRALIVALVEQRDRNTAQNDPAMAEVYATLAALVADVTDDETRVLRALQTDLDEPPTAA